VTLQRNRAKGEVTWSRVLCVTCDDVTQVLASWCKPYAEVMRTGGLNVDCVVTSRVEALTRQAEPWRLVYLGHGDDNGLGALSLGRDFEVMISGEHLVSSGCVGVYAICCRGATAVGERMRSHGMEFLGFRGEPRICILHGEYVNRCRDAFGIPCGFARTGFNEFALNALQGALGDLLEFFAQEKRRNILARWHWMALRATLAEAEPCLD
jgi:hypothetical protein